MAVILTRLAVVESQQRQMLQHAQQQQLLLNAILQKIGGADVTDELPDGVNIPLDTLADVDDFERAMLDPDTLKQMACFMYPSLYMIYLL